MTKASKSDGSLKRSSPRKRNSPTKASKVELKGNQVEMTFENGSLVLKVKEEAKAIKKVFAKVAKNDPAIVFHWNTAMQNGVQLVNNMQNQIPIPPWLHLNYPFTADQFQTNFLQHCQDGATAGGIIDNCIIAPNTQGEFVKITSIITDASWNPLIVAVANSIQNPIATIHFLVDGKVRLITASPMNLAILTFPSTKNG